MKLIEIAQQLVWFPGMVISRVAQPFDVKFETRLSSKIASMTKNFFDEKFQVIVTSHIKGR